MRRNVKVRMFKPAKPIFSTRESFTSQTNFKIVLISTFISYAGLRYSKYSNPNW